MKMRYLLICGVLLFLSAFAKAETGETLLENCNQAIRVNENPETISLATETKAMECMSYINGIMDVFGVWQVEANAVKGTMLPPPACIPEGATLLQLVRVVVKYLQDNPKDLNKPEGNLAMKALGDAYPCQKQW